MKKQQLDDRAAWEAERAEKRARARKELPIYLRLQSVEEAVSTLKPYWPELFEGNVSRLLACCIREMLYEDMEARGIPLSHKR